MFLPYVPSVLSLLLSLALMKRFGWGILCPAVLTFGINFGLFTLINSPLIGLPEYMRPTLHLLLPFKVTLIALLLYSVFFSLSPRSRKNLESESEPV